MLELHCTDETQKVETARISCLQLLHRLSPDPAVTSTHYQKERIVNHFDGNCLLCMSHSRVSYTVTVSYCRRPTLNKITKILF